MSDKKIKQYYTRIIKEALKEVEKRQNEAYPLRMGKNGLKHGKK
jgi:hypothetical protein